MIQLYGALSMPLPPSPLVEPIRTASRELVRALGFTGTNFAGTALPPSAVHALIEIEAGGVTARALGERLRLEKSSVSRMLRKLVASRLVQEGRDGEDGRIKRLSLTPEGQERVAQIHAFAQAQVSGALARLHPDQAGTVLDGLRLYTAALGQAEAPQWAEIVQGYQPGLIAAVTRMHALYYARVAGFGQRFESVVAAGLAEFCNRLDRPCNGLWTAVRQEKILGSVAIDGEDLGGGVAHLRWFIVEDGLRGGGVGRRLLQAALGFVDAQGFAETQLWTFGGLAAARHLYEGFGFALVEERPGAQWGSEVLEQRFTRRRP
ncbi:MarR family winged helix-turn-helix transcriptional regulator [Teichococcus cervicalis]|uniref:Acetyltransferase, GNAT family n=1 Tax=Pseudoroseomonas cervicalis ATCC 49957 TaxID=525371 RepID=D5RJR0_9PROT|nr:MarR family winged helix-turn-helix transcriptional regulator [Pseudoroseomonas cervicalis]EFH12463.1 acetyltransferase, GNAT family [Pseudoroseomonas cervicalis ATCC 49957]